MVTVLLLCSASVGALDRNGFEDTRFVHLGVDAGLSQSTVRAMAQDEAGFIWLATQDGLNRYDGYEFRVFRRIRGDHASLPDNHVLSLAAAERGGLWVGTQNGGLALLDPVSERFQVWQQGDAGRGELASNTVSALLAHHWGGLWIASGHGRIQVLRNASASFESVPGTDAGQLGEVRALREAGDGAVLVASSTGVWRIADATSAPQPLLPPGMQPLDANDVAAAFDGSLWVATGDQGAVRIDAAGTVLERIDRRSGLPHDNVNALLLDRGNRLWIATFSGLARWNTLASSLDLWAGDSLSLADSLSAPRVHSLFEDRDGLLWVGTWTNGVNLHDPRAEAFKVARPAPGHPRASPGFTVVGIERADDESVWLALNDSASVVRLDLQEGVQETFAVHSVDPARRLPTGMVRAVAQAEDGTLWVALGRSGLARKRPGGVFEAVTGAGWNVPEGEIYTLRIDREGTLWVSSIGGGLASLCRDCRWFERYRHDPGDPESLPGDEVNLTFQSRSGSIWVATRLSGLARLDRSRGKFERYAADEENPEALAHNSITSFAEDAAGTLWIGTQGGGLHRAVREAQDRILRFERINRASGLAADAIGSIQVGYQQDIWIATTAGLSRLDPDSGLIENYGPREGALPSGYFIGSGMAQDDGRLLFGGARGLSVFDPRDVQRPPPPLRVAVSEVRVFGAREAGSDQSAQPWLAEREGRLALQLSTRTDDFAIDLTALTYASPDQLLYEYRLEGLDRQWTATDARRRFAAYTNVPPGNYLFRARALRPGGKASEELRLPVQVAEHLGALERVRRLALPIVAVLVAGLLGLAWQRQRERLRAQQRMRESEQRLKLALWGTGDELWDLDLQNHQLRRENPITYVTSGSEELVRDSRELDQYIHPEDKPVFQRAMRALLRGDSEFLDVTCRVQHVAGGWVWLRSRGRIVGRDAQGRALRITGTTSDMTELHTQQAALEAANRELEQRVEQRTQALSEANRSLGEAMGELQRAQGELVEREKMAALGGLVAGVAHEINTPLGIGVTAASHLESSTRQFLRRLGEGKLTRSELQLYAETAEESADLILRNLHRADKLIKSFKQVAVDQSSEEHRSIDLATYVEEVLTSLRPTLRKAKHEVVAEIPPGLLMHTLPGAIYHVLSNLVQNSLVHGFAGRDGGGHMHIRAWQEGDSVVLEYRDDGVGMSEEVRRRMFEPFFTTRRGSGGSGLGMHIVYNTVTRALGGTISCESVPGQGVTISLRLPLRSPTD